MNYTRAFLYTCKKKINKIVRYSKKVILHYNFLVAGVLCPQTLPATVARSNF
jgi:hypothetical protein